MVHQHNIHASVYWSGTTNFLRYRNHKVNMAYSSGQYNQRFKVDLASSQVKFQDEFASRFGVDLPALAETQRRRVYVQVGTRVSRCNLCHQRRHSLFRPFPVFCRRGAHRISGRVCVGPMSPRRASRLRFFCCAACRKLGAPPQKTEGTAAQPPAHRWAPKHTHTYQTAIVLRKKNHSICLVRTWDLGYLCTLWQSRIGSTLVTALLVKT